jgi:hypothetical protein
MSRREMLQVGSMSVTSSAARNRPAKLELGPGLKLRARQEESLITCPMLQLHTLEFRFRRVLMPQATI